MGREVADAVEPEHRNDTAGEERAEDLGVVVLSARARAGSRDARLVTQDLRLELLELRAGLDSQLLDEPRSSVLIRVESLRLPARAVEGQHELAAQGLAERVLTQRAIRARPRRHRAGRARDPPRSAPRARRAAAPRDGGSPPARSPRTRTRPARSRATATAPARGAPAVPRRPPFARPEEQFEPTRVDLLWCDAEHVSRRARLQHVGAELASEPRNRVLERGRRGLRRLFAPDEIDEPIGRDHPSRLEQQRGEQRPLLLTAERDRPGPALDLEGAQDPELKSRGDLGHVCLGFCRRRRFTS